MWCGSKSRGIINGFMTIVQSHLVIVLQDSVCNLWFSLYFQACKAVSIAN